MPRRWVLSEAERDSLLALPENQDDLIRHYTFSESDLSIIRPHRGTANRLGFAVQLCYMRYPGRMLGVEEPPFSPLLSFVSAQLKLSPEGWTAYGQRAETRREHLSELQSIFGFQPFTVRQHKSSVQALEPLAQQTDKGIVLAKALIEWLRNRLTLLPPILTIERVCAEAITRGNRHLYSALTASLTKDHLEKLEYLLNPHENSKISILAWLRQSPSAPNAKHLLEHLDRLEILEALRLPDGIERRIHQNRLLKLAREGTQMTAQHLRDLESTRRHATLVAIVLETKSTVIDEIVDLHDRIMGRLFNRAKQNHAQQFQESGKAIHEKMRLYGRVGKALLEAKAASTDAFSAIEAVMPWEAFAKIVAETQDLTKREDFDHLYRIGDGYAQIRRYAPALLDALHIKAAPAAQDVLEAMETLKTLNEDKTRKVPQDVPTGFVRKRWEALVFKEEGVDRRFYELCTLSELKNALRSGDIWVQGSRQFKDFEDYLLPPDQFATRNQSHDLALSVSTDCNTYLHERLSKLTQQLAIVSRLAKAAALPDAAITKSGLKITPLSNAVPDEADALIQQAYGLQPHVKITELLVEVDQWTDFTRHFTHLKTGDLAKDKTLLLTAILSDAINLSLSKMAESCPGTTYAKLAWLQAWHVRDDTYSAALSELVNAQFQHPFSGYWGDGKTSSSDGQRFRVGGHAERGGNINPKYGSEPGIQFYTHVSDQYAPFHAKVINVGVRDATYVLDGLLYHESDLRIEEHYTDTAGFTDHVFGLMHLLDFRFAPRIRDLADKRLYVPGKPADFPDLAALIGGSINLKHIRSHWDEILRLAASIKQGTVTASLMLRKLGSYPRQNGLAVALRELGRIERSLFTLDWLQNIELRRRVNAGLNKGEARNALARAVFFNRLGEIRDRSFEHQRHRASGLTLVTAAIVLWNTVYLERAIQALRERGQPIEQGLLEHLSPLGWEHINLTGDYVWQQGTLPRKGEFRPLRTFSQA